MEVIKNKRILALIGIVGLLLGVFLPYLTVTILVYSESISLWGYLEGKIVLVLTLANALFIFKDWIEKYVPQLFNNNVGRLVEKANNPKFSLVPTILIAVFVIYLTNKLNFDSEYIKNGLGFYSLWLGVICLVGHAIFYKNPVSQNQVISSQQPVVSTQPEQVAYQQPIQSEQPTNNMNINKPKFCTQCGSPLDPNSSACTTCGKIY